MLLAAFSVAAFAVPGCGGGESAVQADCRARDDAWAAAVTGPYGGLTRAGDRQREAIGTGSLRERHDAQVAVWRAQVAFAEASRSPAPCSKEALELRLLALEMGGLATQMLTLQREIDRGEARPGTDAEFRRIGMELVRKTEEFNRAGLELTPGE